MTEPRKSRDRYVEDEELGVVTELEPIEIEGSLSRANAIELDPIEIVGDPNADVEPFAGGVRMPDGSESVAPVRRDDGVSTMLPDWVPPWATQVIGQPVEGMGGTTDWEVPEWAAEVVADSDGAAPEGFVDFATSLAPVMAFPPLAIARQFYGDEPTPEARTASPLAAAAGAVDAGSFGLSDDIIGGVFGDEAGEMVRREMATTERQSPGSFAAGATASTVAQMGIPGAGLARQAAPAARAGVAAAEGFGYGLLEGFGRGDAPTFQGRVEEALPTALLSGGLGGALGGASARYAQRAAEPVDEAAIARLMSDANLEWAAQAGAAQSRKRMRQLLGGDADRQIANADFVGEQFRELGITEPRRVAGIPLPPTEQMMQERFARAGQRANEGIRETVARMDAGDDVNIADMLPPLRERLELLERTPGGGPAAAQLRGRIQEFERLGDPIYAAPTPRADAAPNAQPDDGADMDEFLEELGDWELSRAEGRGDPREAQRLMDEALGRLSGQPQPARGERGPRLPAADRGEIVGYTDPQLSFAELQRMKRYLYANTGLDVNAESERTRVYEALRDRMQQAVDEADPDMGSAYRANRRTSSTARRLEAMGADRALQDAVNRRVSPSDYMGMMMGMGGGGSLAAMAGDAASVGGASVGAIGGALVAGAANRVWRANEHGLAAMSLERAARRLRSNPERFGRYATRLQQAQQRGPQAFAAALYIAQQNDEAVRAAVAEREDVESIRAEGADDAAAMAEIEAQFAAPPEEQITTIPDDITDEQLDALFQ